MCFFGWEEWILDSSDEEIICTKCRPLVALPVIILSSPSRPGIGTTVPEQKKIIHGHFRPKDGTNCTKSLSNKKSPQHSGCWTPPPLKSFLNSEETTHARLSHLPSPSSRASVHKPPKRHTTNSAKTATERPILHGHLRILAGPAKSTNYTNSAECLLEVCLFMISNKSISSILQSIRWFYMSNVCFWPSWSKLEAEQCQICLCRLLHSIARLSLTPTSIRTIQHSKYQGVSSKN